MVPFLLATIPSPLQPLDQEGPRHIQQISGLLGGEFGVHRHQRDGIAPGQLRADQEAAVEAMLRHDITVMQSLVRKGEVNPVVQGYGQPILSLQCGPIRHAAQRPAGAPQILELVSRTHQLPARPTESGG